MKTSPIIHEWFYPEGPDTLEYLLPVESFPPSDCKLLHEWTQDFASLSPNDAKHRFEEYLDSIDLLEISAFTRIAKTLSPYSVIVHEADSWLLCKHEDKFNEPSAHGNMLQFHAPHKSVEWPTFFDSDQFNPIKHFLRYFGNSRIDIPPTCGTLTPINMQPVSEDLDTFAWKNIQTWDGSYPVYNLGNGDVVLVNSNCKFGIWRHELCDDPSGAVRELGAFAQFIEFAAKETGIAT